MKPQSNENHSRWVPGFHFVLSLLLLGGFIISLINLFRHLNQNRMAINLLLCLVYFCGLMIWWYMRQFAIKAQDRAIRAEESLRYFLLTGKAIDSRITMQQIIALRFAPDDEFIALTDRAASE